MKSLLLKIPATTSNLGPGFDCLAIAFNLYNTFKLTPATAWQIAYKGIKNNDLLDTAKNSVITSYKKICQENNWQAKPFKLEVECNIPLMSGLGSSATAFLAGIIAAYKFNGQKISQELLVSEAYKLESHPDNIVAAVHGGFTCAFKSGDNISVFKHKLSKKLDFLIIHPDMQVSTKKSRLGLPKDIPLSVAINNIASSTAIAMCLITENYISLVNCSIDEIHENNRFDLKLNIPELKKNILNNNGYLFSLSGSGPSLLVIHQKSEVNLSKIIKQHFKSCEQSFTIYNLKVENNSLKL